MKSKYFFPKDLLFILPPAIVLSAGLAALQAGSFLTGWLGFSTLLCLGLIGILSVWRWAGGGKVLGWMTGLALLLRLLAGVSVYIALPINGHNVPDDKAGFVFTDAHRRDDQVWQLASTNQSLSAAFDKTYYTDQYGGLLALSALTYKIFSPDAHRPLLILLLAALTAAFGVPFLFKSIRLLWDERLAALAAWLFVLYPESILTGGAQMREPFLLTFIAMALWGFAVWLKNAADQTGSVAGRAGWVWIGAGLLGLLLVSPAMAIAVMVLFGGWLWFQGERKRLPWPVLIAAGLVLLISILFFAFSLSRQHDFSGGSPVVIILNWTRNSVKWVIYQLARGSGQVQNVFSKMNPLAQFLFVIGYGIAQPVLPPAFFDPTTLTWHIIAVFRALGWYLVLPFLLYAPIAAWRTAPGPERRLWIWLTTFAWAWILICAIRAGGSQWDNPRYRLIFFGFEALVIAYAWLWWRDHRDAWLPRILTLEILCLLLYGEWYVARYEKFGIHIPILVVIALSLIFVLLIFVGGWLWDRWRLSRAQA